MPTTADPEELLFATSSSIQQLPATEMALNDQAALLFDSLPATETTFNGQTALPFDPLPATEMAFNDGRHQFFNSPSTNTSYQPTPDSQYLHTGSTGFTSLDAELGPDASNWSSLFEAAPPMSRTTSGTRFSSSVGITKTTRRATKPLKALDPESVADPKDRKRMKNTEAARKSRAKKEDERAKMEAEIARLKEGMANAQAEAEIWKARCQGLVSGQASAADFEF